jgi:hypothetical protein
MVLLETSIGEAFDKLSILELKLKYITDNAKRECVQLELSYLQSIVDRLQAPFFYKCLMYVNDSIWQAQERLRSAKVGCKQYIEDVEMVLRYNDARCRVKDKINALLSSTFKEKKSYHARKLLLFPHQGMGDQLTMVGAVRYLSMFYDKILLVVREPYFQSVRQMYSDDATIEFRIIDDIYDFSPNFGNKMFNRMLIDSYCERGYEYKGCMMHNLEWNGSYDRFHERFYTDLGLTWSIRSEFGHIVRDPVRELEQKKEIVGPLGRYIFIHDHRYTPQHNPRLLPETLDLADRTLPLFHPNDPQQKQSSNILDYCAILEGAEEIHMVDSSFFCLCHYLKLDRKKLVVYGFQDGSVQYTSTEWTRR